MCKTGFSQAGGLLGPAVSSLVMPAPVGDDAPRRPAAGVAGTSGS